MNNRNTTIDYRSSVSSEVENKIALCQQMAELAKK